MKKCKPKKKKYQIGGNIFGILPGLNQYKGLTNSWNNYWNNGNYFGAGNVPPIGTYADPNAMLYNTFNTNNHAYKAYSDNQNVLNNTYSGSWGDDAHNYYFNKTVNGKYTPEQLELYSSWEKEGSSGDIFNIRPEAYDNWKKDRNAYANEAGKLYDIDKAKRNVALENQASVTNQMGDSITNTAAGIFTGLNYLNSYNPEPKDYMSKGSKGYMYQKGGNVNYTGYTPGTQTYNNDYNVIPSNNITMKNTPFPVLGIGNNGYIKTMQPGFDYKFGGASYVTELPMRQFGGVATMVGNVRADYMEQENNRKEYNRRMDELGANQEFGPMVSTPEFNNKMYESTYNRINNNVTNPLPDFAPSLNFDNAKEISKMKSTSEKVIYNLEGDKTWEYAKEGNVWLARKKGSKKWIDLSTAKNVNYNKVINTLENNNNFSEVNNATRNNISTKNQNTNSNSYSQNNVVDPYNLNSVFGNQYTEPNNYISNRDYNINKGSISPAFINTNNLPNQENFSEFVPNANAFIPTRIMTPSIENQERGTINMIQGAVMGQLAFGNPYAAAATGLLSGIEGATIGTDYVNGAVGFLGAKEIGASAYKKSKPFLKRGKSVVEQQREKVASGDWVSNNLKYFRNEKGQLQSFKDTRGTLQRVLQDNTISSSIKKTFSDYLKTGKKLTKDAYSKLSKKDKSDYDQFFKEENLMQQTINERAKRGVATSFNNFQFGGEVTNNTIIEPRFEEEQEIQTEIGEMIVLPKYDIVKVKADKLHKHMKDDDVTDILPEGSYILSNDPRMKLGLKTKIGGVAIEDIKLGKSVFEYKENEITAGPKDIYFKTIFKNKKELTPAQLATNIKNIYKTTDLKNDYFATRANNENKNQRAEYLDVLKAISEYKKPKSKEVQKAQYGLQVKEYNMIDPASIYMSHPFGKVDNNINNIVGYGTPKPPKAQLGKLLKYTMPGALPLEMYFKNKAGKKADKLSAEENKRFEEAFNKYQQGLNTQTGISNLGALAGFAAGQNVPREAYDDRVEQIGLLNEMDKRNRLSIAAQMYGYNPAQSNSFNRNALSVFGTNAMGYAQNMRARDMEQTNNMRGALNSELRNNNSNYFNSLSGLVSARNADKIRTDYAYDTNKYNATVSGINDMTGTFSNSIGLKNNFNLYRYNNEEALRRQQNLRKEQMQNKVTSEVEGVAGALGDVGLMIATGGMSGFGATKSQNPNSSNPITYPSDYNPYGYDPLLGRGMNLGTPKSPYTIDNFYNTNTVIPGFSLNRETRFNIF